MKIRITTLLGLIISAGGTVAVAQDDAGDRASLAGDAPEVVSAVHSDEGETETITPVGAWSGADMADWLEPFECSGDCWLESDKPALHMLRNQPLFGELTGSVGGELRYRYLNENNRLRPGGPGRSSYNQWRFAPFMEAKYGDWVTGHVQAIDSSTFNAELPELPIDENRADLLQYYVDLKVWEFGDSDPLRFRYGRQLLKYGAQRLVSPLGWSNTYRNFEGYRGYYDSNAWAIDAFAVQPVNGAAGNVYRPTSFDTPDQSVWFSGVYATWKEMPHGALDLYWLWLHEEEAKANRQDGRRHTIGARYAGSHPVKECDTTVLTYTWDLEGAWQFGTDSFVSGGANQDVSAGFISTIGGVTFDKVAWKPSVKGIFWWGSGDDDPTDGDINTLTTLYPLGHAYWGLIDNFNGANLIDYSVQVSVKPTKKLTLLAAMHWFEKEDANDFIYNIAGAPLGPLGTPKEIGQELDLVATYAVNPNLQLQLGYFWFWYADAVDTTALARDDASQIYFMSTWAF
ncbi:hypothetical protein Mal4_12970 [Maioricimonas rarisocia]|uniref:Alginate export domain-containing protein n=1 Tax=Maioricimonas rarisocia TaxID=2528026 RepID=A0A517Z3C9_9PLAN|nr:alginate export family protein [Maioricimonas rarisocia]QDU36994.1 hypothetical protein Mal4_12970 [Maioricimonas rarisocia]